MMDTIRAAALGLEEEEEDFFPADGRTLLATGGAHRAQAEAVREAGEVTAPSHSLITSKLRA